MNRLTVILPVHNEAEGIEHTLDTIYSTFDALSYDPDFIVVDDGSTDDTWSTLTRLAQSRPYLRALSLSRNFGKERALLAGIKATTSEAAIVMDADLQHPPEIIPQLVNKWRETNCDVVHAVKSGRNNESSSDTLFVKIFYFVYGFGSGISLQGASDFKLLNRRALDSYAQLTEHGVFFRGLVPWLGFHQETVPFIVAKRNVGKSKWGFYRRMVTAINAITSFSTLPLHLVTIIGIGFLIGAIVLGVETLYVWWTGGALEGFTTVIILLLIIGATIMISLGIIGKYIAHIYDEVRGRPVHIIKDRIGL